MTSADNGESDAVEVYTRAGIVASTIWLHGLGVGGSDMDGIVTRLRRSRELGLHHLAPNAPLRRITVNDGQPARAWYDIAGAPGEVPEDHSGIAESAAMISRLLHGEHERGIPPEHTILGGFSQGASLALYAGLRHPRRLGGIVMFSGELLLAERLEEECHPANRDTPILMLHGTEDEVVPVSAGRHCRDRLREAGYQVEWRELPVGHQVPEEAVEAADEWIYPLLEPAAR